MAAIIAAKPGDSAGSEGSDFGDEDFSSDRADESGESDHESIEQDESGVSDHERNEQDESGASDHESIEQDESGASDHEGSEQDESGASDHEGSEQDESDDPNKGWADAMAKILNKKTPADKGSAILVKSKTLQKEKEKEKQERLEKKKQFDKKRQWEMMSRVRPDVVRDRESERGLQRIATRGVVQLFNAVKTHQYKMGTKIREAGGSERKKSKLMATVSKRDFIDVLRGKESKGETAERRGAKKVAAKTPNSSEWNILRDDFMMGASMKDWDKDSDEEGGAKAKGVAKRDDSGSDSDR